MAEVSCWLGARALRIPGLSVTRVQHTADVAKVCTAAVSSTPDDLGHEYLTELTENEGRQLKPVKDNGEPPSLECDFDRCRGLNVNVSDARGFERSSEVSLAHELTGYHVSFLHETGESQRAVSRQQSSPRGCRQTRQLTQSWVASRRECVQRVSAWGDRPLMLLRARLSGRTQNPVQQFRMFSACALQSDTHARLFYCLSSLWPRQQWSCVIRSYSWRKDDKSKQPLFRSRTAYYDILQVTPSATQAQIKTAYYKQSFIFHPDKNAGSEEATRRFAEISEAYMVLGSKWLRRKYDSGILSPADLQGNGHPSSREPPPPATPRSTTGQQYQRARSHGTTSAGGGRVHFDFDAFYQAHYGEQLQREQEMRKRKEMLQRLREEEWRKFKRRRMTEVSVTVMLTLAGMILLSLMES